jgi:hypothetical protein
MRSSRISAVLIMLLVICSGAAVAQSNYKKAFIIKNNGDTLSGFVNYREWYRNPDEFSFRSSIDDKETETFTAKNVSLVEIEGLVIYQRFFVTVSTNEVEFNKLTGSSAQPVRTDTVFLQLLAKGKHVSLYAFRDDIKQRFYILEPGKSTPVELSYRVALMDGSVNKFRTFRQQLLQLAEKSGVSEAAVRSQIDKSEYIQADIVKAIHSINGVTNAAPALSTPKGKWKKLYLGAGVNYSTVSYSGRNVINSDGVDNNDTRLYKDRRSASLRPLFVVGTDLNFKKEVQTLYVRLEVAGAAMSSEVHSVYKFNMYSVEELSNTYTLSAVIFSFQPQVTVNWLNTGGVKGYLGAGPSLHYFLVMKNELYQETNQQGPPYSDKQEDDFLPLKDLYASVFARVGVTIRNQFDVSVSTYNPVQLSNTMDGNTSAKYMPFQLLFAYKFP